MDHPTLAFKYKFDHWPQKSGRAFLRLCGGILGALGILRLVWSAMGGLNTGLRILGPRQFARLLR